MGAKDDATEYLDPMHSIGYLSRINFRAFSAELEKLISKYGVTTGQWRFLRVLWEEDDITQRELSDRVGIKEATTVRALNGLADAGLVVRSRSTSDKRKKKRKAHPQSQNAQGQAPADGLGGQCAGREGIEQQRHRDDAPRSGSYL